MKEFVLGDIHGRYKALVQVFERANFDFENDICYFVGDIVDRGTEPFECIDFMMNKVKNAIFIKGNHDYNFERWISGGRDWLNGRWGVAQTLLAWKYDSTKEQNEMMREYFTKCIPYYIHESKNIIFVHAGFNHTYSIKEQEKTNSEDFAWNRNMWEIALKLKEEGVEIFPTIEKFNKIYIGHTATTNYFLDEIKTENGIVLPGLRPITYPLYATNIWNVDTGAGFNEGKLTLMNIDTEEIFQSDLIKTLYA